VVDILKNTRKPKRSKAKASTAKKTARKGKTVGPAMIALDADLNTWVTGIGKESARSKRDVVQQALRFAKQNGFVVETYVPPAVEKWLAKAGRSLAC